MTRTYRVLTACVLAAAIAPSTGAHAQYYGSAPTAAPLYPYAVQPGQPYAVEVAPGTYVIQRPTAPARIVREEQPRASSSRKATRNDPKLIDELRQRHAGKTPAKASGAKSAKTSAKVEVVNTRKVVVHKPVVVETTRIVDDPPKVVIRKRYVDDTTTASIPTRAPKNARQAEVQPREGGKPRVIEADAEVTVLGPDRMSIRLFRKGSRAQAKAE